MDSSSDREKAAAAWLAKRVGDWSDADEAAFKQWLEASTRNRVAFIRVNTVWQQAARLKALRDGVPSGAIPAPGEWRFSPFFGAAPTSSAAVPVQTRAPPAPRSKRAMRFRAIAATVALMTALSVTWYLWPAGPSYRTPVGGVASVPISDGSKVTLNTDSEIRVALTDTERRVDIERGEAFFEVAKDATRPFVVSAGRKRIIAIGTKFSVRRDADDVRVVVTEGRVRIEDGSAQSTPPAQLAAGTVARASATGVLLQARPLTEVEEYLSWRSGYLVFRDLALADAVAELNRYNTRQIVIDDPAVGAMRVGGTFRATNVAGFLRLLQEGYPVRIEQRDAAAVLIVMERQR